MPKRKSKVAFPTRVFRLVRRRWWLLAGGAVAGTAVFIAVAFLGKVPLPDAVPGAQSSKILAADGQLIANLHGEENRTIVPLDQISKNLQDAVISAEDRGFYTHPGISLKGIIRAAFANLRGGVIQQGGSTITQQYVRNAFSQVGRERTIFRKVREAALAVKFERKFSKPKILEFYLNTVYFGKGAYGSEAAARTYFDKSAKDLSVAESAYLAGIIRAPETFEPGTPRAESIKKEVIADMVDAGKLLPRAATAATAEKLEFRSGKALADESVRAAYFVEFIRLKLKQSESDGGFGLSDAEILGGGLTIHTTLDLRLQKAAEDAITSTLDKETDPEAALVAVDTSGNIRAMVGGRVVSDLERARGFNFATMQNSKGTVSGRQPGSAFKPFTLAAWIDSGKSIKSTFVAPSEVEITSNQCKNEDGSPWKPSNFDGEAFPPMEVAEATVKSVNTVYAQMIDVLKPRTVVNLALDAGVEEKLSAVCSLTLGTSPLSPLDLARAYSTFAARGEKSETVAVTKIVDAKGAVAVEKKPTSEPAIDQNVADTVNYVLEQNIQRGTGTGAKIGRPAAGKTGTTQNHVDAWFVGYTPHPGLSAAVWMGFRPKSKEGGGVEIPEMSNVRGRRVTGGSFPATIWRKFMIEAVKGSKALNFTPPNISGEVTSPSPTPCPTDISPSPGLFCMQPSPSPSPVQPPPGQEKKSPSPSPSPTVSPSPSPSPT